MKNLALICGDSQLDDRPTADRLDDSGRSIRFQELIQTHLDMVDFAEKRGCKTLIYLGDLVEIKNPSSATMKGGAEFFTHAIKNGFEVQALAGNHDGSIYSTSSSSLEPLAIMSAGKLNLFHKVTRVGNRVFLPYLHQQTPQEIKLLIQAALQGAPEGNLYLFGHYGVSGARIGAKNIVVPGDMLDADTLCAERFKAIVCGHLHKQQTLYIGASKTPVYFPGSPAINDHGEREDPKGFGIMDLDHGSVQYFSPENQRLWITIPWNVEKPTWTARDIVKFNGEYLPGELPRDHVANRIASGLWPEPFFKSFETLLKTEKSRVTGITAAGGLRAAAQAFVESRWPAGIDNKRILNIVLDRLRDVVVAPMDKTITPTSLVAKKFMSHDLIDFEFSQGTPTLIIGDNGMGKTNILEAILFVLTGNISKDVDFAALVKQGEKGCSVEMILHGETHVYKITRMLTLTKTGASHKVKVAAAELKDGQLGEYTSLADGGIADTQAALTRILGATYTSLKATNFLFQKDASPFIQAKAADRKAVLSEILGFDPLLKAYTVVNDERLKISKAVEASLLVLNTKKAAWNVEKLEGLKKLLHITLSESNETAEHLSQEEEEQDVQSKLVDSEDQKIKELVTQLLALPNYAGEIRAKQQSLLLVEKTYQTQKTTLKDSYNKVLEVIQNTKSQVTPEILNVEAAALAEIEKLLATHKASLQTGQDQKRIIFGKIEAITQEKKTLSDLIAVKNKELDSLKLKDIGTCGRCGQKIDSTHIQKHMDELTQEIVTLTTKFDGLADKASSLLGEERGIDKNISSVESNIKTTESERDTRNKKISGLQQLLNDLPLKEAEAENLKKQGMENKATFEENTKKLNEEIKQLKEQEHTSDIQKLSLEGKKTDAEATRDFEKQKLLSIDAKVEKFKTNLGILSERRVNTEKQISDMESLGRGIDAAEEEHGKLEETLKIQLMAGEVLDPRSGLPVYLIDERIPELQESINRYMLKFGATNVVVKLVSKDEEGRDTLKVILDNGKQPELDINSFSGGQHDRVEFCIKMALADLSVDMRDVSLGLLCMDEPGVYLKVDKKLALVELIHERVSSGKTPVALAVSNDEKIIDAFSRRLLLQEINGVTTLTAA